MADIECTLDKGITVGDKTHRVATLREHTAGDVIESMSDSEKVVATPDGYQLVQSPSLISVHTLRRQIVSIGDIKGPLEIEQLKLLSSTDMDLLNDYANRLDVAAFAVKQSEATLSILTPAERQTAMQQAIDAINSAVLTARSVTDRGRADGAGGTTA
jgi:phage FluMu protein gp41